MRTTITIPDEYYKTVKKRLGKRGFNTLNEYLLDLIRKDDHQFDAALNTGLQELLPNPHQFGASTPVSQHQIDAPIQNEQPRTPPKFHKECPHCGDFVHFAQVNEHFMTKHGDHLAA